MSDKGGLIEALFGDQKGGKHHGGDWHSKKQHGGDWHSKKQHGGASGDGYSWHRQNAVNNLGSTGRAKRDQWLDEVRTVHEGGVPWKDALKQASTNRQAVSGVYRTHKQRVIDAYKPRNADSVRCTPGKKCPGKYDKPATATYRPGARSKRVMTEQAAVAALRKFYREVGLAKGNMGNATKGMRQDISKKKGMKALKPCGTSTITVTRKDGVTYQRRVPVKTADCADSWLYRGKGVRRHDMQGVDAANKKISKASGKSKMYNRKK